MKKSLHTFLQRKVEYRSKHQAFNAKAKNAAVVLGIALQDLGIKKHLFVKSKDG